MQISTVFHHGVAKEAKDAGMFFQRSSSLNEAETADSNAQNKYKNKSTQQIAALGLDLNAALARGKHSHTTIEQVTGLNLENINVANWLDRFNPSQAD